MKKIIIFCIFALLFGSVTFLACSNDKEKEAKAEKGTMEKMTDKAAKKMVNRIRTPMNKARSVKVGQEKRLDDMDESLK